MKRQGKDSCDTWGMVERKKNGRRKRRPGYRRHKAGTAYGCFVSDLTRFAANPCIGPGRRLRRPSERIICRLGGMGKCPNRCLSQPHRNVTSLNSLELSRYYL